MSSGGMFDRLGDTLCVLRLLLGVSQAELAERAGIRSNQISRYETGVVLPQLPQLEKILTALGVGPSELLFTMSHLDRIARLIEESERSPAETLARDAVTRYWQDVTDLHLKVSREVSRVIEEQMGGRGDGR
jgi:transcriptional regulator with XRE-family HTH domain